MKRSNLFIGALSAYLLCGTATAAPGKEVLIDSARFTALSTDEQAHVLDLKARMETILATDKAQLDREERQALRSDWRALKEEMANTNRDGTVIYISTAGIIIILLLLIILL